LGRRRGRAASPSRAAARAAPAAAGRPTVRRRAPLPVPPGPLAAGRASHHGPRPAGLEANCGSHAPIPLLPARRRLIVRRRRRADSPGEPVRTSRDRAALIPSRAPVSGRAALTKQEAAHLGRPPCRRTGGVLLSQALASQVPSALRGLTALFGMGRGVSPSPRPPEKGERPPPAVLQNCTAPQRVSKISVKPSTH
jgi:hypothetical protein